MTTNIISNVPESDRPTIDDLRRLFKYNSKTGELFWLKPRAKRLKPGDRAGSYAEKGYRQVEIYGRGYREHHVCFAIFHGRWPANQIDHKNGVVDDNRICNLRECTRNENAKNRRINRNSASGYKGVSFHKASGKWAARVQVNNCRIQIGLFSSPELAYAAYKKEAKKCHGEFMNAG